MKRLVISLLLMVACASVISSPQRMTREEYILMYKEVAIKQMLSSGIPASITMAQACLESNNGNSRLAVEGNNHFGIKCHGWAGDSIRADDDALNECFRKYSSAEESFSDHSDFLRFRDRYAKLFELDPTDYKGWARGLKEAGYATSPVYADNLIRIIEDNKLYLLDILDTAQFAEIPPAPAVAEAPVEVKPSKGSPLYRISLERQVYSRNGVSYVLAESYDSYSSIAEEYRLFRLELLFYNDLKEDRQLEAGEIVYLERKKASGARHLDKHVVEEGETMYSIAQRYAIRLKALYSLNGMNPGEEPAPGTLVKLRK